MPISQLRPADRKVRKVDDAHLQEIANSIAVLGFCVPLLIGRNNAILDGHTRFEAARRLGLEAVPCIEVGHLSEPEQRVLRLAVNRLGEKGQWDLNALKTEFAELITLEVNIDVSGFSLIEIDQVLISDEPDPPEKGPLVPAPNSVAVSRLGDVFRLGPHRLICGDAREPQTFARLMEGDTALARLVLTDEPYNVPIAGHVTGAAHREFAMASGEMTDAAFLEFNQAWMRQAIPHLADGGLFGTFIDWRGYPIVHAAAADLGLAPINLVVWTKTNAGMGSLYRSQHELLPLFKKGTGTTINNVKLGSTGRWRSNVWTYPGASSIGSQSRKGLTDHPTVKPTIMLKDALLDVTNRGDIVIDPFLGSGSMLMAAEETGRVCRGIEIDPLYVDLIIRRFEDLTSASALLDGSEQTFADLAAERYVL